MNIKFTLLLLTISTTILPSLFLRRLPRHLRTVVRCARFSNQEKTPDEIMLEMAAIKREAANKTLLHSIAQIEKYALAALDALDDGADVQHSVTNNGNVLALELLGMGPSAELLNRLAEEQLGTTVEEALDEFYEEKNNHGDDV